MHRLHWILVLVCCLVTHAGSSTAQKKLPPGAKPPEAKAPEKKEKEKKPIVYKGQELWMSFRDTPGKRTTQFIPDVDSKGNLKGDGSGFWTYNGVNWDAFIFPPKDAPELRVYVPFFLDGKITVMANDLEVWSLDMTGRVAKGIFSPSILRPGDYPGGVRVVVRATGRVSDVFLTIPAKNAPAATPAAKDADAAGKAAELLARAKEAMDAKNTTLARIRLNQVINQYASTPSAEEARILLKKLEK